MHSYVHHGLHGLGVVVDLGIDWLAAVMMVFVKCW